MTTLTATPIPSISAAQLSSMVTKQWVSSLASQSEEWTDFGQNKIVPWAKRWGESIDPLAVSCAIFRTTATYKPDSPLKTLTDPDTIALVTENDIKTANDIREHRGKELVMAELHRPSGVEPNQYERELASFLGVEDKTYNLKWEGMIYKLPEFYKYDCDVAELKAKHFTVTPSQVEEGDRTFTLKPLKKLRRVTRNKRVFQYWFADASENIPVVLEVKFDNPLDSVWSMLFDVVDKIEVTGKFYKSSTGRLRILASDKWKVDKL